MLLRYRLQSKLSYALANAGIWLILCWRRYDMLSSSAFVYYRLAHIRRNKKFCIRSFR